MANTRRLMLAVLLALRSDDELAAKLYADTDIPGSYGTDGYGTVPFGADPQDRERIYLGDPARDNAYPVEVSVRLIASGSSHNKSVRERSYQVQCDVVATQGWYKSNQRLAMADIWDAVDDVAHLSPTPGTEAAGMAGAGDDFDIEDGTGRRILPGRWRFETSDLRY